jgi:ligand-binding sensor domain-containing protein
VVLPEPIHKARLLDLSLSRGFFLLFVLAATAWAVDPSKQMTQYAHTAWRIQDGFFNHVPTAVTQTTDGYLWIGTKNGLMRFDGVRFVPWKPTSGKELSSSYIAALLGARDGSLWIGTASGLSHLVDGDLIQYPDQPGVVGEIMQRTNGEIWFSLGRLVDASWESQSHRTQTQCYYGGTMVPWSRMAWISLTGTSSLPLEPGLSSYAQQMRLVGATGITISLSQDGSM